MPVSDQGVNLDRYMVIPRVLIFGRRGDTWLLIKGAPEKRLWANLFNGVGGHVEPGEDVLTAANRELREETGLKADLWLCGTLLVDTGQNPGIAIYVFTGDCHPGDHHVSREGSLHWVHTEEIPGLPAVEDLSILIGHIKGMTRGTPPFAAHSSYDSSGKLNLIFTS